MGSFISLDNVYKTNFYRYEGLYTTTLNAKMSSDCFTKSGLNDFVISDEEDYITKIMIKIDEIS